MLRPALGPARKPTRRIMLLKGLHYIGLDVHKKTSRYVIKTYAGQLVGRGQVVASPPALSSGAQQLDAEMSGWRARHSTLKACATSPGPESVVWDSLLAGGSDQGGNNAQSDQSHRQALGEEP